LSYTAGEGAIGYFASIEKARFRKPVVPGDQLLLEVEVIKCRRGFGKLRGVAKVDEEVATEAEFVLTVGHSRSEN
jgi:3-hydroxyacyl-[acyl-carrier-protein] dehydratase